MSIRSRLLLMTLFATLVAAGLLLWHFMEERSTAIRSASQRLPQVAQAVAQELEERVQGAMQLQYGLARARDLASGDRASCSRFLARVRALHPQYTGVLTIQPDGQLFCDSLNTGRRLDLRDRAYFRRAVQGDAAVLQAAFGRLTGKAVLQIAYPARDEAGTLLFVLLASLDLQRFAQADLQAAVLPGTRTLLVDRAGVVLAGSGVGAEAYRAGESLAGTELFRFASTGGSGEVGDIQRPDGVVEVWSVADSATLKEAGILALAGHTRSALVARANQEFTREMTWLASLAALMGLGMWIFTELAIRRPVATIADMVRRMGRNEVGLSIAAPHPRGEFGQLMEVLNQSAAAQDAQRASIAELHAALLKAQRLEAVGQLTGGIAHDFNNLLTVILGNAELLQEHVRADAKLEPLAAMVVGAAERGAQLTQRLLAFARKQALEPQAVDVNDQVAALDSLLQRTLGEDIEIRFIRGADLWPAQVDPAQLDNALLNLCLNSRDAMPEGGQLTIETSNLHLSGEDQGPSQREVPAGDYVLLAVSDTGCGIAPEHLGRVFEPFFTTKGMERGTGLGLPMIYGFVKQSGGHVSIYSELREGTTVRLYLPRAAGVARAPSVPEEAVPPAGGAETILLVEDDAMVRAYARERLANLGYRVVEARDGGQALALLARGDAVDLLFTDVVMPGMNGRELAGRALALAPGLRVLFTTGYAQNAIVHHGRLDAGVHLLAKPYTRDELARRVREALAAEPAAALLEAWPAEQARS